jgi:hypothetical protein
MSMVENGSLNVSCDDRIIALQNLKRAKGALAGVYMLVDGAGNCMFDQKVVKPCYDGVDHLDKMLTYAIRKVERGAQ